MPDQLTTKQYSSLIAVGNHQFSSGMLLKFSSSVRHESTADGGKINYTFAENSQQLRSLATALASVFRSRKYIHQHK